MDMEFAGLILAGGEGRRFGRPKAFAELGDGQTFLLVCHQTLVAAGANPVIATLPPGSENPGFDGLHVAVLPEPGIDMFGSLKIGLHRLIEHEGWESVAIVPVDHPLVRQETVRTLMDVGQRAAIPSYRGKHGHPVFLGRAAAEAIAVGNEKGPTLREVLRGSEALTIEVDDPGVVANCNTPETLSAALAKFRRSDD